MSIRTYEFVQLDVFTQTPLAGNPLAVFVDARGLSDSEMQALAREMNLSETTFILPRDAAIETREGKKVRIFTVSEELPFAGHPTLGTALYLHALQLAHDPRESDEIILDLRAGKIPVHFSAASENAGRERVDGQVFGEMRQRDPEFGTILSLEEVAAVIGIGVDEIASEWPIQVVSTGLPFAIVPFRHRQTWANLKYSFAQSVEFLERTEARFFTFFARNGMKIGLRFERACFFSVERIRLPDRRRAVPPVGWCDMESQKPTSRLSFGKASRSIVRARSTYEQQGKATM
jgi:trans-2,3-dihydro-3-hydroxyanthranilate isomerase